MAKKKAKGLLGVDDGDLDNLEAIVTLLDVLAPNGIPWEKMRRSENVEDRTLPMSPEHRVMFNGDPLNPWNGPTAYPEPEIGPLSRDAGLTALIIQEKRKPRKASKR